VTVAACEALAIHTPAAAKENIVPRINVLEGFMAVSFFIWLAAWQRANIYRMGS